VGFHGGPQGAGEIRVVGVEVDAAEPVAQQAGVEAFRIGVAEFDPAARRRVHARVLLPAVTGGLLARAADPPRRVGGIDRHGAEAAADVDEGADAAHHPRVVPYAIRDLRVRRPVVGLGHHAHR
jgi:hypothetical protein